MFGSPVLFLPEDLSVLWNLPKRSRLYPADLACDFEFLFPSGGCISPTFLLA